jgi:predicted HTH transcriptional regulator
MEQMLFIDERVKNTIQLGESHFREFKSAWDGEAGKKKQRVVKDICKDIAEALVSFANADGGDLLVGVEDDGTVTGIPHGETEINAMLNALNTRLLEGFKNIYNLMDTSDLKKPEISTDASSFAITLYHKSHFSDKEKQWLRLFDNFKLTRLQQRIVVLGIDGIEISPSDIYSALNIDQRDNETYTREISPLRNEGILMEIRTKTQVANIHRTKGTSRNKIKRFKVVPPNIKSKLTDSA